MNTNLNRQVQFLDLGLRDYKETWDYQTELFDSILSIKLNNRERGLEIQERTPNYLIFCEHPHVYTLGKSGDDKHLLADPELLDQKKAVFYRINRGGDITYHGPEQLVAYPILDLENFFTDIHLYMRNLEEAVIRTLDAFGLQGQRLKGMTGVWLDTGTPNARKICAMGVKTSRWVTMHGIALNVNTDLQYFSHIVPCGIDDKSVTSLEKELGEKIDMEHVKSHLMENFAEVFEMDIIRESVKPS